MFDSLHIQNYKSHADSLFEFHNGMNVFVGATDEGKSAAVQALRWVCQNQPQGDNFRSWWGGDTIAELTLGDAWVKRSKIGTAKNLYEMSGYAEPFKAFGNSVPEPILKLLNLAPINWQLQHDRTFLLSETAGEVGRQLNEIVDLDIIDTANTRMAGKVRDVRGDIKAQETVLAEQEAKHATYDYIPQMEKDLAAITVLDEKIKVLDAKAISIEGLIKKHTAIAAKQAKYANLQTRVEALQAIVTVDTASKVMAAKYDRLSKTLLAAELAASYFAELNQRIETMQGALPDTCPTCQGDWDAKKKSYTTN